MEYTRKAFDFDLAPLNSKEITVAEYIWIGGTGSDLRSKTMVIHKKVEKLEDLPVWNYDGSSTLQASTDSSEILLKPVFKCPDPFRMKSIPNSILVLCETFEADGVTPAKANFRHTSNKIMSLSKDQQPWFGFEQEYILLKQNGQVCTPLGFNDDGEARPQGEYYCSIGSMSAIGRVVAESHLKASLAAGLQISGLNAEVFPGQWEYQVGPVEGINGCDQLWISRYLLYRVAEDYGIDVTFDPKPIKGDWNGSGMHTNFSTTLTRSEGGLDRILKYMDKLSETHCDHLKVYGLYNESRLTGLHETSSMEKFTYDIAHRGASVRIPSSTAKSRCGYFEDRRPAGNADPYLVGGMLVDSVCNGGTLLAKELLTTWDTFIKPLQGKRHLGRAFSIKCGAQLKEERNGQINNNDNHHDVKKSPVMGSSKVSREGDVFYDLRKSPQTIPEGQTGASP